MRAYAGNVDTIRGSPVGQFQRFGVEAIKALTCKLATISASCRVALDEAIGHGSPFGFSRAAARPYLRPLRRFGYRI